MDAKLQSAASLRVQFQAASLLIRGNSTSIRLTPSSRCRAFISSRAVDSDRNDATNRGTPTRSQYLADKEQFQTPFPRFPFSGQIPIESDGKNIRVEMKSRGTIAVPRRWLRDMCPCAECRNQDTAQRQINVLKPENNCRIAQIETVDDGSAFNITFEDGHVTKLSRDLIATRSTTMVSLMRRGRIPFEAWNGEIESTPPTVRFSDLEEQGLGELLRKIRVKGFCFVDETPPTPEATEKLLSSIGPIRNTHYGGFYDFTADLSSKDTAYTSESLEPHTDNTYFTEPAGLQALHLLSHTDGSGGESSLVDGFYAAQQLFNMHKPSYRLLSNIGVWAHASGNDGISIQPEDPHPVIGHDERSNISQIRWNNADRAGLECNLHYAGLWYTAASRFDAILNDRQNQYWFQLTPGKVLIFDNWRVLHGRAAFTGKRRMCGGYINRDDFISKFRMTNMTQEEIGASTVTG